MQKVEIVEAKAHYCGMILRRLRLEHAQSFAMVGLNAHRQLRETFSASAWRRAAFMNDRIVGLGGVTGSLLSPSGFVWLCLTNEVVRHPILVLREVRRQIDEIMRIKTELYTTVLPGDESALRLCSWLGFHVGHDGLGAPASDRAGRRLQMEFIRNTPEARVSIGNSYAIALGYHKDVPSCVSPQ